MWFRVVRFRRRSLVGLLPASLVALAVLTATAPAAQASSGPLNFATPQLVATGHNPDYSAAEQVDAVACPSTSLCVALGNGGQISETSDPAASTPTWSAPATIDPFGNQLNSIACPSTGLCVAVDVQGQAMTTTDPATGASTWSALTAAPASGSTFAGWSGAGCSGTGNCTVTLSADQSVTATFNVQSSSTSPPPTTTSTPPPTTTSTPPPTTTSTTAAPRCELTVRSSKVLVTAHTHKQQPSVGRVQVVAKCNQAAHATLNGTITVRQRVHGKLKTTKLAFARTSASVRAATQMVIDRTLPKRALTALRAGANESVSFTLTATNANGSTHAGAASARLHRVT